MWRSEHDSLIGFVGLILLGLVFLVFPDQAITAAFLQETPCFSGRVY